MVYRGRCQIHRNGKTLPETKRLRVFRKALKINGWFLDEMSEFGLPFGLIFKGLHTVSFREGKYHTTHTETKKKQPGGRRIRALLRKRGGDFITLCIYPLVSGGHALDTGATVFLEKSIIQTDCQPL